MALDRPATETIDASGKRVAIVAAKFNQQYTDVLLDGAVQRLKASGISTGDIQIIRVPGAFELPIVVQQLLAKRKLDGVIAIGAVIRGDTPHFDYVCQAASDGLLRVSLDTQIPVAFGVITCEDDAQAKERCNGKHGNKGDEAAEALLQTFIALETI